MLKEIKKRLENMEELVLVTVVASSGATPRGSGARMLIGKDGRICGTIGGGAVEYRSEHIAAQMLKDKASGEHDFTLTAEDVQNLGMVCGGAVKVFFSYIPAGDKDVLSLAVEAERRFSKSEDLWLLSELSDGGRMSIYSKEDGFFGGNPPEWTSEIMKSKPARRIWEGRDFYAEKIGSSGKVYIFGCGHVSQELQPVLSHVGFRCVVMDDRPEFTRPELFPTAEEAKLIDFEKIADYISICEEDYVCVMTRGHAFDFVVQAQVLKTPAAYIGVIGSRHKTAAVMQKLRDLGYTDSELARITTPIGLAIKAETPAEIAISIAAQLILHRAERDGRKNK